jgi:GAF domain-containing protein/HAMP domain-containing protein
MSILLAETITGRIVRLTAVASEIAGGNLAAQADVESPDEVGLLATTFNNMSAQLKNTLDGLEQTVAERTKELEEAQKTMAKRAAELQSVAEISTKASAATNVDELLQNLVELTKSSFNLYHTHVYLVDQSQKKLVLAAGAGDVGKQMVNDKRSIPLDHPHSLVARAARTLQGAISNDVTREPDFLPNPLLPETRAEMAIPIIFGDSILGVLDVQADHVNRFTDEDIAIKTTLAGQIAVSLQNVRSFAEVQARAEREALIGSISQKIQGATTVESVLQITARELGRAVGSKQTRVILKDYASATPTDNKS